MESFHSVLVKTRSDLGYKTSKGFFNFLKDRGLECNYQYYVKIEKGSVFPSTVIINQLAKAVSKEAGEEIIRAFCAHQFDSFSYLFKKSQVPANDSVSNKTIEVNQGQKELTPRQIAALIKKKENYFLFLLLTLSRSPLNREELKKFPNVAKASADLMEVGIAFKEEQTLVASSTEFRFPQALDEKTKSAYVQFDEWDLQFSKEFGFQNFVNKMMIRRISPRYFGVICKQIEALTDFVRCSDESDKRYNNEVLHLHIKVSKGELPG